MLNAGRLRHKIRIESPVNEQDEAGQVKVKEWALVARPFAEVLGVGGGESLRGRQIEAQTTHLVTIHWRAGILPTMRVVHEGRLLNIVRVDDPEGDRRMLVIQCEAMADA